MKVEKIKCERLNRFFRLDRGNGNTPDLEVFVGFGPMTDTSKISLGIEVPTAIMCDHYNSGKCVLDKIECTYNKWKMIER